MANQILSKNKFQLVLRLLLEGKSRSHINRNAGISRKTVDKKLMI